MALMKPMGILLSRQPKCHFWCFHRSLDPNLQTV